MEMMNLKKYCILLVITVVLGCLPDSVLLAQKKPNIILIMTDDQGYSDLGCYGADYATPHIDGMAKAGKRFTNYYAASNVCTPSRAAMLTGCYPERIGLSEVLFSETGPAYITGKNKKGLAAQEETIAELLKANGYKTACSGKWHLGYQQQFLPLQHGFDEFFGIPYSHDMHPQTDPSYPALPLIRGNKTVSTNPPFEDLTKIFTDFSVDFIRRSKNEPFFLYLAYSMPHVPLAVSKPFKGITGKGLYADAVYEIDASVGRILETLKKNGIEENTLIIFTSDNGPWLKFGNHAGKASGMREGKGATFDGGHKVPFIVQWKEKISPGTVCDVPLSGVDVLPTLVALSGSKSPKAKIDGHNASKLFLKDKNSGFSHPVYFFENSNLQAVRLNDYKYHFPHDYQGVTEVGNNGKGGKYATLQQNEALYNVKTDSEEKHNLLDTKQHIAKKLKRKSIAFSKEIETNRRKAGLAD